MSTDADKLSFLERSALRYFRRSDATLKREDDGTISFSDCCLMMQKVERAAIWNAAFAGMFSGLAGGAAAYVADPLMPAGDALSLESQIPYFTAVFSVTALVSTMEVLFLYWNGLYAAVRLNEVARRCENYRPSKGQDIDLLLVRSALELPEPVTPLYGIDPLSRKSKLRILLLKIAYKSKIAVTNFILKAVMRRILGRAAARYYIELVGAPVFAFWNAFITFRTMRESKMRAIGSVIVHDAYKRLVPNLEARSEGCKRAVCLAVREAVMSSGSFHPNAVAFLEILVADGDICVDSLKLLDFEACLRALDPNEKKIVVNVLILATCLNGHLSYAERSSIRAAQETAGLPIEIDFAQRLLRYVRRATPLDWRDVGFEVRKGGNEGSAV